MTYLEMCQALRQEVSGSGSGPNSVLNQVGELKRLVTWIARADEDVQRKHNNWLFMRSGFTVHTVSGTASYSYSSCTDTTTSAAISRFRDWDRDTFKSYLLSAGVGSEIELGFMGYQDWYSQYNTGIQVDSQPIEFSVLPSRSFVLGPAPSDVYVVSGDYWKSVTTMSADSSTPLYPSEYHMLPVYRAMMSYGVNMGAPEVYQSGKSLYQQMLNQMELTQLPEIEITGSM